MAMPRRAVRVALYFLVVLGIVWLWGSHMPREHVAMRTVELAAPPSAVYAAVRDLEAAPTWRTGVTRVELLPDRGDRKVWREFGDETNTFELLEDVPEQRVITQMADLGRAYAGRWIFQFAPTDAGGTRLIVSELGDVTNPLLRFFGGKVFGFGGTLDQYVVDLRAHVEGKRGA